MSSLDPITSFVIAVIVGVQFIACMRVCLCVCEKKVHIRMKPNKLGIPCGNRSSLFSCCHLWRLAFTRLHSQYTHEIKIIHGDLYEWRYHYFAAIHLKIDKKKRASNAIRMHMCLYNFIEFSHIARQNHHNLRVNHMKWTSASRLCACVFSGPSDPSHFLFTAAAVCVFVLYVYSTLCFFSPLQCRLPARTPLLLSFHIELLPQLVCIQYMCA